LRNRKAVLIEKKKNRTKDALRGLRTFGKSHCYFDRNFDKLFPMAKAVADPEELRRFAEELKRFNSDLSNSLSSLQARFSGLGETWQDHEHAKFAEDFQETMKVLRRFMESSGQQAPFLLRKAQRIEEYLNQR
jgi:uncharacterized protein YukE